MPTATAKHAQGTFCWPELGTTDQDGAKRFYSTLFGWSASETPMGPDMPPYVIFMHKGVACGARFGQGAQRNRLIAESSIFETSFMEGLPLSLQL